MSDRGCGCMVWGCRGAGVGSAHSVGLQGWVGVVMSDQGFWLHGVGL